MGQLSGEYDLRYREDCIIAGQSGNADPARVTSRRPTAAPGLGLVVCPMSNPPGPDQVLINDEQSQTDFIQLVQFYLHYFKDLHRYVNY